MTKRCFDNKWEEEWLQGSRVVDATLFGNDNPAQKQGSALTYARRYSLLMAYGLATEDDDANSLNNLKELTKEDAEVFAESYTFKTGKHANMTLKQIIEEKDNKFMDWLLENSKDEKLKQTIILLSGKEVLTKEEQDEKINLTIEIMSLADEKNIDIEEIRKRFEVDELSEMTLEQMKKCKVALEKAERKE